jgi:hypothetical protein
MKNDYCRDVTGRDVLLEAVRYAVPSISGENAEMIADRISDVGYVCVPRIATPEMLEAARYDALAEDGAAVWETMVKETEGLNPSEEEILKEAERLFPHVS